MGHNTGKSHSKIKVNESFIESIRWRPLWGRGLPHTPSIDSLLPDLWVGIVQQSTVYLYEITILLSNRYNRAKTIPLLWKKNSNTVAEQPVKLTVSPSGYAE
jgi:hypothetical protein